MTLMWDTLFASHQNHGGVRAILARSIRHSVILNSERGEMDKKFDLHQRKRLDGWVKAAVQLLENGPVPRLYWRALMVSAPDRAE